MGRNCQCRRGHLAPQAHNPWQCCCRGRHRCRHHPALAGRCRGIQLQAGSSSPMEHPAMARSADAANKIKQDNQRADGDHHLSEQRARRRHGDDLAGDLRRVGDVHPADRPAGAAQSGLRHFRRRLRLPRLRHVWAAMDGDLGNMLRGVGGTDRPVLPRQGLRPRLPPDHHAHQADHQPRRSARLQDPPAGRALSDLAVPPSRRLADRDQFQRGLQRVADRHRAMGRKTRWC